MVQPPPLEHNNTTELAPVVSLSICLNKLHELLFKITLPKTKAAKLVSIAVNTLHMAHIPIASACSTLQDSHSEPQLDSINKHLEAISAHLGIHNMTHLAQKCTYTLALSTGICHPTPAAIPL